jgi:hypothetical protein
MSAVARFWRQRLDRSPLWNFARRLQNKPTSWDRVIVEANLPASVEGQLGRILRRVRGLPAERAAFAAELVTHCRDGLDAGRSSDDVARSLGDPRKVGRLVSRALRRKRPLIARVIFGVLLAFRRTIYTVAAAYGLLAVVFFTRSPAITTNHLAELNAATALVPPQDRAAPEFVRLHEDLTELRETVARELGYESAQAAASFAPDAPDRWFAVFPELDPARPEPEAVLALLERAQPIIAGVHAAAARPKLGADLEIPDNSDPINDLLIGVLLPHLGQTRSLTRLLALDAAAGAQFGDADRATDSLEAMARVAALTQQEPFFISRLVGYAVLDRVSEETMVLLRDHPDLLRADHLARLSAALAITLETDAEGERRWHDDVVQHCYSPRPDGRLTPRGVRILHALGQWESDHAPDLSVAGQLAAGPITSWIVVDRATTVARYQEIADTYEALAAQPMVPAPSWSLLGRSSEALADAGLRDPVNSVLVPAFPKILSSIQSTRTQRDAARLAIAFFQHRLDHGTFPDAACDLVPSYLDELPIDRFDGHPLRTRLAGEGPVIYALGPDRDDDHARRPDAQARGTPPMNSFRPVANDPPDADWVLFPPTADDYAPIREFLTSNAHKPQEDATP